MASYEKRGKNTRVRLRVNGQPISGTFPTKQQATKWAQEMEAQGSGLAPGTETMGDAFKRYAREVTPTHKGEKWELVRLATLGRTDLAKKRLAFLKASDISDWQFQRLQEVGKATVAREFTIINSTLEMCRKNWGWIAVNPAKDIKKVRSPPSRKRRITQDEADRVVMALGYEGGQARSLHDRVALAFLFALETAMRDSEILGLKPADVKANFVVLPDTKNGDARNVPLSKRAAEILTLLPPADTVFDVESGTRGNYFRAATKKAQIINLHFHDSRAEAIWRLSKKLDVMELARMIGHRDINSLLIYYQTSADELSAKLG